MGHSVARDFLYHRVRGLRTGHQTAAGENHRGTDSETSTASSDEIVLADYSK
jgi:hypothetical protein